MRESDSGYPGERPKDPVGRKDVVDAHLMMSSELQKRTDMPLTKEEVEPESKAEAEAEVMDMPRTDYAEA